MRLLTYLLLSLLSPTLSAAQPDARIAIIIDDIGYHKSDLALVDLPFSLTYAVLPHTPYGATAARQAFSQQKEVMLHIPMEASNGKALGPGALTSDMSKQQIQHTLQQALANIPYAIGVNNHMGSFYTAQEQPMAWMMEYLRQRQLFFVDSLTTPNSTAAKYASHYGVTLLSRHVFLDNIQTEAAIAIQFEQLLAIARKHHSAIAIGHPYAETYRFLQKNLPVLQQQGIELVSISALLPQSHKVVAAGSTAAAVAAAQ